MLKKNDMLNTSFDTYMVLNSSIGNGGNGTVYKVQNTDGGIFAAKVVCKTGLSTEKLKRFRNEIGFCQKYSNPYVISIVDNGFLKIGDKEYLFYIMPCFDFSLRKIISAISIEESVNYFLQICEGLKFAHSKSCIHRDIKPENILIDAKNSKCVIADFGIAHFCDDDKKTTIETKYTNRLANFTYHAPEQINSRTSTLTVDIFALGLILNEMITGSVPAGDAYKKIADVNADYSFLDKIVSKMISQNPSDRYQSVEELLLDYSARKRQAEQEKKIKSLREPLLQGDIHDSITDNPIKAIDIKFENGLTIILSNKVNSDWTNFYHHALNSYTSMPYCYKDFIFSGTTARYQGTISYLNEQNIKSLIQEFKNAVEKANQLYASWLVQTIQRQRQEEIENRKREIERLEKENNLNNFLKGLL